MNETIYQPDMNGVLIWNPQPAEGESILWEGSVLDGYAEGYGQLTWYWNGNEVAGYIGTMHMGRPHGTGRYRFADGDVYEGEWLHGLRHGIGKHWYQKGGTYDGSWVLDKPAEAK